MYTDVLSSSQTDVPSTSVPDVWHVMTIEAPSVRVPTSEKFVPGPDLSFTVPLVAPGIVIWYVLGEGVGALGEVVGVVGGGAIAEHSGMGGLKP
jgi:hypothetical protein